jgi:enamine deaminase RidA (YjgF/YER057c/UK114 family)
MATSISHPDVFRFNSPYSTALRAGPMIFVGGTVPADAEGNVVGVGDAAAQTRQVFLNIQRLLEAAGAGLEHLVQVN